MQVHTMTMIQPEESAFAPFVWPMCGAERFVVPGSVTATLALFFVLIVS